MQDILDTLRAIWQHVVYTAGDASPITVGQIVLILGFVITGLIAGRIVTRQLAKRLSKTQLQKDAAHAIQRVVYYSILVIVLMMALSLLHIPLTAFAFVSGAIAIGVGFGAQNILNNFISGWILMTERPVRIGDVIEIEGDYGTVEAIGARSTRIRRSDGVHMLVPNSTMLESTVTNWTLIDRNIRTSITVGVAYGSPVETVQRLLFEAAEQQPEVLSDPPPRVVFEDFGDSALVFQLFFWSEVGADKELRLIRSEIRFRIAALLEQNDISIPFPQRDVHLIEPNSKRADDNG